MDEKISKLFLPLLERLYNTEPAGEPFRAPVDPIKYGCYDYYLYIKNPIDLTTIKEKLSNKQYKDAWRFVADIELMFSNAYAFNKRGTPVYEFTNKLNKIWNQELTPIMQRLDYCCGLLHRFGPQLLFCHGTTPDKYCQITINAKYKCYKDSYSFCLQCFNKIESDSVDLRALSCDISRIHITPGIVQKSEFLDCTNDHWEYEAFVKCSQCTRRVHQICDLYPADEDELLECEQHDDIDKQQRSLCKVPPQFDRFTRPGFVEIKSEGIEEVSDISHRSDNDQTIHHDEQDSSSNLVTKLEQETKSQACQITPHPTEIVEPPRNEAVCNQGTFSTTNVNESIDDDLLQFAREVDDSHKNWNPCSPQSDDMIQFASAKETAGTSRSGNPISQVSTNSPLQISKSIGNSIISNPHSTASSAKNSVDKIAARLSNKLNAESHVIENIESKEQVQLNRDKFVCNHCYRKKRLGFNLRHRKYSAKRLPHTRMSRYIETKVNEHIRENSPTAGEVTIRVLTAYRDKVIVKPQMRDYVSNCRKRGTTSGAAPEEYPDEFEYTNRAIFAWQEIDGVDVCVFGMHVQEYGEDCPEPNKQVVYLSYLDSVHFFRPKQVRTAVYHEILLSYFKYVRRLGFRRVFIWVCPSRKGDDYIFYRHPSEQKMPTLKRLSDWYIHLLDKGIATGLIDRHQNIHEYAMAENWNSLLSMPYMSGDYWPGEFERLLNLMIESQKSYEEKLQQKQNIQHDGLGDLVQEIPFKPRNISEFSKSNNPSSVTSAHDKTLEQHNIVSLSTLYQRHPQSATEDVSIFADVQSSMLESMGLRRSVTSNFNSANMDGGDAIFSATNTDDRFFEPLGTPRSDDQPLDLSKSSSNASPESIYDDDKYSEVSFQADGKNRRKRRKSSGAMGYTKKRRANNVQGSQFGKTRSSQITSDASKYGKSPKLVKQKAACQNPKENSDSLLHPEIELIKNLERSLKRQREGFIVVRLSECDCSPHFESQRRREEITFQCDLMQGREPLLQLARVNKYEFSTLRRAKFSSLAMVKHLGKSFKLDPICNECFSFDSSKRHYACQHCEDFYLCTSCHENTHHGHIMSLMAPTTLPDINEFLQECSLASATNSISSASSTISNKSFNDTSLELPQQIITSPAKTGVIDSPTHKPNTNLNLGSNIPLLRQPSNMIGTTSTSMPLGNKRQRNSDELRGRPRRVEDEENASINLFAPGTTKLNVSDPHSPSPIDTSSNSRVLQVDMDQGVFENFIRDTESFFNIDLLGMKNESMKLLAHYWSCPTKETCSRCKFVIVSCSFMSVLMRSSRFQMMIGIANEGNVTSGGGSSSTHSNNISNAPNASGVNLTTTHQYKE